MGSAGHLFTRAPHSINADHGPTLPLKWPDVAATLSSPRLTLDDYFTAELPPEKVINIIMGDVQRLWIYGRRGWSLPRPVPPEVEAAYHRLKGLGFTEHLIADA